MKKPEITKIETVMPQPQITQISAQSYHKIWQLLTPEERQGENG